MGLLLKAPVEIAPSPSDPFLVVDSALTICALSRRAERLLDVTETDAVNQPITQFLVPADAEAPTNENLAAVLAWAARGDASRNVVVRPTNTYGVRYWARVGPCGPPTQPCWSSPTPDKPSACEIPATEPPRGYPVPCPRAASTVIVPPTDATRSAADARPRCPLLIAPCWTSGSGPDSIVLDSHVKTTVVP